MNLIYIKELKHRRKKKKGKRYNELSLSISILYRALFYFRSFNIYFISFQEIIYMKTVSHF